MKAVDRGEMFASIIFGSVMLVLVQGAQLDDILGGMAVLEFVLRKGDG